MSIVCRACLDSKAVQVCATTLFIKKNEEEIAELKKAQELKNNLTIEQRLAEYLHDQKCHLDHVEQCSWYYDKDWSVYAHEDYLRKATKALEVSDYDTIVKLSRII